MRQWLSFDVEGTRCAATIDAPSTPDHHKNGLLIVSGGNEIRGGAHRGMARLAAEMAENGHPVFRFDRRGVGDSDGENLTFEHSGPDIIAAAAAFRARFPQLWQITAYGNCDAATALALFHKDAGIDALILSNPWTIEAETPDDMPPPSAIRARYLERLKQPAEWKRLLTGGVNLRKLAKGLQAAQGTSPATHDNSLAARLAATLRCGAVPITILLGQKDRTAQLFVEHWTTPNYAPLHQRVQLHTLADGNHSFADPASWAWFRQHISAAINHEK